jgi:NTE family protein
MNSNDKPDLLGRVKNPYADRFNNLPSKHKDSFPRVAYVLQGGGSLGAYQFGVLKGLLEAGYEPDWVTATSIGAIQAAILVGNPPEKRMERLSQFWQRVTYPNFFEFLAESGATLDLYNQLCASFAVLFGQPGFFYPRWCTGQFPVLGDPSSLSYYDTTPLRSTLLELVDFDLLNSTPIRLSLGSVEVSTGHLVYFNNINYKIDVDHVLASGALPPAFPAIKIGNEFYWDGGVHSNSPLEVILEANPPENTLCFLIDCFGGASYKLSTMHDIEERMKDISFSTHAQRTIYNYLKRQQMRNSILKVTQGLTEQQKKNHIQNFLDIVTPYHCTLVHLIYSARIVKAASKDYNFGQAIIKKRMQAGYLDAESMLKREKEWGYPPSNGQSRLYASKAYSSRLIRKRKGDVSDFF